MDLAQHARRIEAGRGQRFATQQPLEGKVRVALFGEQHLLPTFAQVADETVAGAGGDDQLDPVERMCGAIGQVVEGLFAL